MSLFCTLQLVPQLHYQLFLLSSAILKHFSPYWVKCLWGWSKVEKVYLVCYQSVNLISFCLKLLINYTQPSLPHPALLSSPQLSSLQPLLFLQDHDFWLKRGPALLGPAYLIFLVPSREAFFLFILVHLASCLGSAGQNGIFSFARHLCLTQK